MIGANEKFNYINASLLSSSTFVDKGVSVFDIVVVMNVSGKNPMHLLALGCAG